MRGNKSRLCGAVLLFGLSGVLSGCVKIEYVGNTAKGFWSNASSKVPPNDAYREAEPYLPATWEARCEKLRHHDEWCEKAPIDHMVRKGEYYYLTRTSFVYEDQKAYLDYAVRVHADTGEVLPYK